MTCTTGKLTQPYKKSLTLNSEKNKSTQLKNIENRIGLLQLSQDELKKLFSRTSLLTQ